MHQKQPPAKTAVFVAVEELCAGERSTTRARQVPSRNRTFMLRILDTGKPRTVVGNCLAYTRRLCHKRILPKNQRRSLWLNHSECFSVLFSWQSESLVLFPESRRTRCCWESSW